MCTYAKRECAQEFCRDVDTTAEKVDKYLPCKLHGRCLGNLFDEVEIKRRAEGIKCGSLDPHLIAWTCNGYLRPNLLAKFRQGKNIHSHLNALFSNMSDLLRGMDVEDPAVVNL
jgi:hypothetical protein